MKTTMNLQHVIKAGGSAFPHESPTCEMGMSTVTVRDYFAEGAMRALAGKKPEPESAVEGETLAEWVARQAYGYADAMMKERAK